MAMTMRRKWLNRASLAAAAIFASTIAAPQLLAFPHGATIGGHRVYAEAPIGPELHDIVRRADRLVSDSPLGSAHAANQPIFLTDGGWRWRWLSLLSHGAFGLSRPFSETIVINRSDQDRNRVWNGAAGGGERTLHGVLAHEMAHGAIRARFGPSADWRYPAELREGLSDAVARESSLSDAAAQQLTAQGRSHPALRYWRGRKQAEAALERNGGSLEKLFAGWQSQP